MSKLLKVLAALLLTSGPALAVPLIDIEKTTNGPTNANPTAPNFDNEDAANGPGVPILTPGSSVTWTYKVTNTGDVVFLFSTVAIADDNGTPANTADDLTTLNGLITFQNVLTGDADNLLEPGEVWQYQATGVVQDLLGGVYENTAIAQAPGAPGDRDLSHYADTVANVPVPEPGALSLFALGVAGILAFRRRIKK